MSPNVIRHQRATVRGNVLVYYWHILLLTMGKAERSVADYLDDLEDNDWIDEEVMVITFLVNLLH